MRSPGADILGVASKDEGLDLAEVETPLVGLDRTATAAGLGPAFDGADVGLEGAFEAVCEAGCAALEDA